MIYNEVFDYLYNVLAGTGARVRSDYERKRFHRALLALQCQNYFLSVTFNNATGAIGVTGVDQTQPLEKRLIVRGGGINTVIANMDAGAVGAINLSVFRSGSSRAQISKETIRASHYFSVGEAQKYELDWPVPWVLEPNEVIQVRFLQMSTAPTAGQKYNVGFYCVAVDPNFHCTEALLQSIKDQICRTVQYPRYVHLKTDLGAGTITFPAIGSAQRAVANTVEAPEHLLVLGFRRYRLDLKSNVSAAISKTVNSTMRLVVTGEQGFSRIELPINAFELFTTPDAGWFRFSVPHFLPQGASLSLSITSTIPNIDEQMNGEIELLCVTV